jgi:drug/metabolite transporter (DMT)-like permease
VASRAIPVRSHHPLRGLLLFNLGLMLFACMDVTNKYLTASFDVPLIAACRYIGHILLMLAFVAPRHGVEMVRTRRTGLVWFRGFCLAVSSLCVLLAFQRMPVAETSAIVFLAPILVVIAAGPLLGEKIGPLGWIGALLGFAGVLLIVRPGGGLDALGVLFALGCCVAAASYNLLSRLLAPTESTIAMLFYTALAGSILFGALLPWFWLDHAPTLLQGALLAALGVIGGVGHFLFTAAFRDAPASILSPMSYLQLLWVSLLGWLVFGHVPDAISLCGIAIIGASGVVVAFKYRPPSEEAS